MKLSETVQEMLAIGVTFLLIALGIGGCSYLAQRGEALNKPPQEQKESK